MNGKVYNEPSSVASEEEEVFVDGPDGVAVTLTPEAAEETGHRLIAKASEAAGNRRFKEKAARESGEQGRHDAGSE